MALDPLLLTDAIRTFTDPDFGSFAGFPQNDAEAATAWATAIDTYTGGGLTITPPSLAGAAAFTAMQTGLAGLSLPGAAVALFDASFTAYAGALALGMIQGAVSAATPPPTTVSVPLFPTPVPSIPALFVLGVGGADAATQAAAMANIIDVWFRRGTFVSGGGSPAPWA